ncbi:tyrosine-type recombinase/integrase [Psychromonas aquimarina]|uniref:tyrosine-type recombinase/integrase n=1 Tax=Psychromonas aquimarina TaxID=444919 RepID=UPI00041308A9|nr:site-specific integrase [Psychromonas aquimarina]
MRFTATQVNGLKSKARHYELFENTGERGAGRLGVRVCASGNKMFLYRYYQDGKRKFITLGRYSNDFGLAQARAVAIEYGDMLKSGLDPLFELERQKQEKLEKELEEARNGSIQQLFDSYIDNMITRGKRTHKRVKEQLEQNTFPIIPPETKAKDVTTLQIVEIIAALIERGAPVESNRVRSALHAAFQFGMLHDNNPAYRHRKSIFGLKFNPVAAVPKQSHVEKVGNNFLTLAEVKELLVRLPKEDNIAFNAVMLFTLCVYTAGQRPYELVASRWNAVDWENRVLEIKPEISKTGNAHFVPLSDSAIEALNILKMDETGSEYIFAHRIDPGKHYLTQSFAHSLRLYIKKSDFRKFVPRDIRRTAKTLMGEIGISKETRDKLQNHSMQDVSSKHYDRYDYMKEKRQAIELWEKELSNS